MRLAPFEWHRVQHGVGSLRSQRRLGVLLWLNWRDLVELCPTPPLTRLLLARRRLRLLVVVQWTTCSLRLLGLLLLAAVGS